MPSPTRRRRRLGSGLFAASCSLAALAATGASVQAARPADPFVAGRAAVWPGDGAVADVADVLGENLSGLAVAGPNRLWAVRDRPSALLRLERSGDVWTPTSDDKLRYPTGSGAPDAEAVTVAGVDPDAVYVGAERDNDDQGTSRNSVIRYEMVEGSPRATQEWRLDSIVGRTPPNTGVEGLAWIPPDVASKAGYSSSQRGLFAIGIEDTGDIVVVELADAGVVKEVASLTSGLRKISELTWVAQLGELWAVCDSACDGTISVLQPTPSGFAARSTRLPPTGFDALNHEGVAVLGDCDSGALLTVWSDDAATDNHALRSAPLACSATEGAAGTAGPEASTISATTAGGGASGGTAPIGDPASAAGSLDSTPDNPPDDTQPSGPSTGQANVDGDTRQPGRTGVSGALLAVIATISAVGLAAFGVRRARRHTR